MIPRSKYCEELLTLRNTFCEDFESFLNEKKAGSPNGKLFHLKITDSQELNFRNIDFEKLRYAYIEKI